MISSEWAQAFSADAVGEEELDQMLRFLANALEDTVGMITQVCEMPAPSYHERSRAELIKGIMGQIGLEDAEIDSHNNVIGRYPGQGRKAAVAVCAHIDTVFPPDTEIMVTHEGDWLKAPGVGDNSTSVGVMLQTIKAWRRVGYHPPCDVLFVGSACEEGLGDLRGVRGLLDDCEVRDDVDLRAMIALDGRLGNLTNTAVGSKRLRVVVRAEGGHSWRDYGCPSAIHGLGSCIHHIASIDVPADPPSALNVGIIEGGTSVNTIAEYARMLVDMRSVDNGALKQLEDEVRGVIREDLKKANCSWEIEVVGERPAGHLAEGHQLVQMARAAGQILGEPLTTRAGSTDSNIPLSRDLPAITVGVYRGEGGHRLNEKISISSLRVGLPLALMVILGAVQFAQEDLAPLQ